MSNKKDFSYLIGKKYEKLTIIGFKSFSNKKGKTITKLICECDCWNICYALLSAFTRKTWRKTKSCWCRRKEYMKESRTKHNLSRTKIYDVYHGIIRRCNLEMYFCYKNYWWRGIKCLRNSFEEFYRDMWSTCKEWLSIERIDNNWNYCKDNCKRADIIEQSNNKRSSHIINYNWKTQTLTQRAKEYNISPEILGRRIKKWWWFVKAITTPTRIRKHLHLDL